jgi:hypothetical protein
VLNFETEEITTIIKFGETLSTQPNFFQTNIDQTRFVVANDEDGIYINLEKKTTIDLDEIYDVKEIQSIIYDAEDEEFYFLCNIRNGITGFYLIKFPQDDPTNFVSITSWRNNLDIGDSNIFLSRGTNNQGEAYKELICSYKSININTYNTVVLDLSKSQGGR